MTWNGQKWLEVIDGIRNQRCILNPNGGSSFPINLPKSRDLQRLRHCFEGGGGEWTLPSIQHPLNLGDILELLKSFSAIQCMLHRIFKQYPFAQGCNSAEVSCRDFMQQETDHPAYLSAFGSQKKKNNQTHLDEPRYWEGVSDL
jgi:hypothetical protein